LISKLTVGQLIGMDELPSEVSEVNVPDSIDVERLLNESDLAAVEYLPSVGSTQDHAHQLAADANFDRSKLPLLVIADEQTAGRGRGVNRWWTGRGSLAFSLLLDPKQLGLPDRPLPQASLAVGVALIDAVQSWIESHPIGLHWPNDVFAAGRKLSGILIDVLPDGRHILGVGLNVNNSFAAAPEEVRDRATSLVELSGRRFDRTDVLLAFSNNLSKTLAHLAADPESLGERFADLCLQVGHDLTVETSGRRTTGRCAGIDWDGALLLDTFSGRQKIYSGVLR
jgi:BirA family transcriptional regulator, biotin operon repressor / biotin---[acetyl-CoA-carboxylase] ligase